MKEDNNVLIIRKWSAGNTDYMLPLKITIDLHTKVKEISRQANQPLSKVACQLIEFALAHTVIEGKEGEE